MRGAILLVGFLALTLTAAGKSPFCGSWEGRINDLPGVDLTILDTGEEISGVVVFHFQLRGEDGKWRVAGKTSLPMLALRIEGQTLSFEVIHHKEHGGSELGPNVKFRMELTGANEAVLRKLEDHDAAGQGFKLARTADAH